MTKTEKRDVFSTDKYCTKYFSQFGDPVPTTVAIGILETQSYGPVDGEFAIKSNVSGRVLTKIDRQNERMTIPEIEGLWTVMTTDKEKNRNMTILRGLMKLSDSTGFTYSHIDHMSMDDIWEWFIGKVQDFDTRYCIVKYSLESKIVK